MDTMEFREFGKTAVDYIADYFETIRDRPVLPPVQPGYMGDIIPAEAPQSGEAWQDVLRDVDRIVMPGITHWHSPNFHAYFSCGHSFPAVVGELICAGFGAVGLNWIASPAVTELEVVMMNWLGKLLGLPEEFLNCSDGPGGGVIQASASEATFVALLAAKEKTVKELQAINPDLQEADIKGKLVAYTSDQSNSSVEKAGLLGSITMRLLPADEEGVLRGSVLKEAIENDKAAGLIPCYLAATLGTTSTCAFDNLEELGPVCKKYNVWFHVDAAYAGTAFACPEYRHLMKGIEYVDSFNFSPHKWMLVCFDCSAMWVKNAKYLVEAFNVQRIYLKDSCKGLTPEYRHWQISLGRRFRALKLWFVLRIYGVEGIQKHVRHHISLAKHFENLVRSDERLQLCCSSMGLVCFRLNGDDNVNQELLNRLFEKKTIFLIAGIWRHKTCLRFAICSHLTETKDIDFAWNEILTVVDEMVPRITVKLQGTEAQYDSLKKKITAISLTNGSSANMEKAEKFKCL